MRIARTGVGLLLIGAGLAVVPALPTQAAPSDPSLIDQMRGEAHGKVHTTDSPATGRLSFIRAGDDLMPSRQPDKSPAGAAGKAKAYLAKYGAAFGASGSELPQAAVAQTPAGYTVDFNQTYHGLPVFGAKVRAHVDKQGDLTAVGGYVAPNVKVSTTPTLDRDAAAAKATKLVQAHPADTGRTKVKVGRLSVTKADLSVYRMGAIQGVSGRNLLAWVVEVTDTKQVRETVVLDAKTGKPVNRYSMVDHALDRELHETSVDDPIVWKEGDAFPAELDEDQQNEVVGTGESYWFFKNSFGRDSYDGAGAKMITVNNDPSIQCPNANWNGTSTNYCSGVSSDDTVSHEWGHAYTEKTSGLLYQWQPGGMNEAYSDIWGETVDMLNDRYNETPDVKRAAGDCSKYSSLPISISIVAPADIARKCVAVKASGGPDFPGTPTDVTVIVGLDDQDLEAGDLPTDGCSPFTNAAAIAGNWVYVDENLDTGCGADTLADYYGGVGENAVAAGAEGIIFGGDPAFDPWDMPGATFTIPAAEIDGASGAAIKSARGPATLRVAGNGAELADSYRWLSGEGDTAFGGAIRDMWNPTCYGDPGKVSDQEYYCGTADSGGVHTNSGVVNHTYALLVDGGTYNGVEVPALGLDKAAHIFWHTQTNYLTPTSGFAELADGLEASCADLTGVTTLKKLAVGQSATGGGPVDSAALDPITAEDCAAVSAVAQATELRTEPVQCNFKPMFERGTIGCGDGTVNTKTWSEGFEGGTLPAGWTQDAVEYGPGGHTSFDPTVTDALPTVTKGGAAHTGDAHVLYFNDKGNAGNFGSCAGDENDYSSRVGVKTPELTVPEGALPRLSFDHYVASEVGWDGGNVKVSVNGGAFDLVPQGAWLHNGPGATLSTVDDGSTNPMAGEQAFTGTDGGEPTGAWGNSVIDLADFAAAGDTVQFRFDFGMDGCNGIDGWYIDNVTLSSCTVPVVTPPEPGVAIPHATANARKGVIKLRIHGAQPTGLVRLKIRGHDAYRAPVIDRVATFKAKRQLHKLWKQGVRRVWAKVSYAGDEGVKPFSRRVLVILRGRQ